MNSIKSTWVLLPFLPLTLYNVTSMIYFHRFPLCIQKKNICLHCIIYKIHQIIQFQQINTYNIFDLKLYMCTLCMRFHYLWWIFLFGKAIHVYIENNLCLSNEIHFGNQIKSLVNQMNSTPTIDHRIAENELHISAKVNVEHSKHIFFPLPNCIHSKDASEYMFALFLFIKL